MNMDWALFIILPAALIIVGSVLLRRNTLKTESTVKIIH